MENKGTFSKEKFLAWLGVGLGALALFLVVFGPGLKEAYEEWKAEQTAQAELREQERQKSEQLAEGLAVKESRADWTYEDYAAAARQTVIDETSDGIIADLGREIDSEEELASLKFDRVYVTNPQYGNKSENDFHDLIVWYTWQSNLENKVTTEGLAIYYDMDETLNARYRDADKYGIGTVGDFVDYWIKNQEHLVRKGGHLVGDPWDVIESRSEGCITLFTAEDFEAFYNS